VPPLEGLVSWWPGEENADDIQNGNDGTLQNGTTFAAGMVGQAFSFDGIDDSVHVGNAPTLHVSAGSFTVEAWVKFDIEGVFQDVDDMSIADKMSHEGINQDGWRLMRQRDHGHFWFCLGGGEINGCDFNDDRTGTNATSVRSTAVARQNVWYHVAAVLSSDQIAIYVNGIKEDEKARPLFTDTHVTDLLIGNDLGSARLDGLVDEVSIYNRALSAEEIAAIFTAGSAGKCIGVPLAPLAAQATLSIGSQAADDTFALQAAFILGDGSNGIDPLTEAVSVQVGTTALTIPAGSFHRTSAGAFEFAGVQEGVTLHVTITPLTRASFEVVARGEGAELTGMAVPVAVGLTIGDDSGSITLPMAEVSAQRPPPQR
jgi:hypothetical protein